MDVHMSPRRYAIPGITWNLAVTTVCLQQYPTNGDCAVPCRAVSVQGKRRSWASPSPSRATTEGRAAAALAGARAARSSTTPALRSPWTTAQAPTQPWVSWWARCWAGCRSSSEGEPLHPALRKELASDRWVRPKGEGGRAEVAGQVPNVASGTALLAGGCLALCFVAGCAQQMAAKDLRPLCGSQANRWGCCAQARRWRGVAWHGVVQTSLTIAAACSLFIAFFGSTALSTLCRGLVRVGVRIEML